MNEQEKVNRHFKKYGYSGKTYFNRPHWTRRGFFQLAAGVGGAFLGQRYSKAAVVTNGGQKPKGTASNVIFILLNGAPSHTDTFDLKDTSIAAASSAGFATLHNKATYNGVLFPQGLMPNLA